MKKHQLFAVLLATSAAVSHVHTAIAAETQEFKVPDESTIPAGPLGDSIRLGRNLVNDTVHYAKGYVGNGLNCTSCHQEGGTKAGASPFVGLATQFPAYNPRAGKVFTLQDRINGCFRRSMNGKELPLGSEEMTAMVAYMTWLSKDVPMGTKHVAGRGTPKVDFSALKVDLDNGKKVYAAQCAACHGADGQGMYDANGTPLFPAVWGEKSFNVGAGMARLYTAASFVKANMPQTAPGSLSAQDALDVSAYFTTQPRPDFPDKVHDWPKGGKPKDARY